MKYKYFTVGKRNSVDWTNSRNCMIGFMIEFVITLASSFCPEWQTWLAEQQEQSTAGQWESSLPAWAVQRSARVLNSI